MKRFFILFLSLMFVLSFTGCGGGGGGSDDPDPDPDPPAPETPWLCFTANEAGSTVSTKTKTEGTVSTPAPALEYSKEGTTWIDFELSYYDAFDNLTTAGTTVELASGEKMYIRAKSTNAAFSDYDGVNSRAIMFLMTGSIAASGNVMSLLDKDCKITVIPSNMCFYILFGDCDVLTSAPELPATSLKYCCYEGMFARCSALTKITVHFTDWNTAGQATYIWVMETPASGDFYCPAGLATGVPADFDDSKVPTGWTVHNLP